MKTILALALGLAALAALPQSALAQSATGHAHVGNDTVAPCAVLNKNSSDGNTIATACAPSTNSATGGAGGLGGSVGAITVLGGAQGSVTVKPQRQAPAAFAPNVYSNAPCTVGVGLGASIPGGGLSFGGATLDVPCNDREDVLMLSAMGRPTAADARLCMSNDKMRRAAIADGVDCALHDPRPEYRGGALSRETACHEADNNPDLYLASRGFCN